MSNSWRIYYVLFYGIVWRSRFLLLCSFTYSSCWVPVYICVLWLGPTGLFLASPMHSRWKLTSIRRCSGGITESSANNLNSWYSWGSISRCPKFSMLALKFFPNHWRCFVGRSARRIFGDDQRLIAEYSPNNHRTFADIFYLRCIGESRRSICETSAVIRR